jgi:hypothetical protein
MIERHAKITRGVEQGAVKVEADGGEADCGHRSGL